MKIYLDDKRLPPDSSWVLAKTPKSFFRLLLDNRYVEEVSLDFDLGLDTILTGLDILRALRVLVLAGVVEPHKVSVHTAHPSDLIEMRKIAERDKRLTQKGV